RIMLLRDREAGIRLRVTSKCKRETDRDGAAIRPPALALEPQRRRSGDAGACEGGGVRDCIGAFQEQQRESFMRLEEDAIEGAEQRRECVGPKLLRLGHGQKLDEEAGKLDQTIVRAPGMAVARPNDEAEALVEGRHAWGTHNRLVQL